MVTGPAMLITVLISIQIIHMRAVRTPIRIKSFAFSFLFIFVPPKIKYVSRLVISNHDTYFSNSYSQIQPKTYFILPKISIFYGYKHSPLSNHIFCFIVFWDHSVFLFKRSCKVTRFGIAYQCGDLAYIQIAF